MSQVAASLRFGNDVGALVLVCGAVRVVISAVAEDAVASSLVLIRRLRKGYLKNNTRSSHDM